MICLCQLCERLLLTHAERLSRVAGADGPVARALVLALCRPGAPTVRSAAAASARRLGATLGGAQLSALLLDQCQEYITSAKVQVSVDIGLLHPEIKSTWLLGCAVGHSCLAAQSTTSGCLLPSTANSGTYALYLR